MIFQHSDRFKAEEKTALSYANFSDYLRQQFLNSRQLFTGINNRPNSAKPQETSSRYIQSGRSNKNYDDFPESPEVSSPKQEFFDRTKVGWWLSIVFE
jgi:hypothetical protein